MAEKTDTPWWAVSPHPFEVKADTLFEVFGFPVTNTVTTTILSIFVFLGLVLWVRTFTPLKPSRAQLFFESIYLFFLDFLEKIVGDKNKAKTIVPIAGSLILFLLIHNLLFIFIPLLGAILYSHEGEKFHFFRVLTSDLNVGLALSVSMFVIAQIYAFQTIGIKSVLEKYIQIKPVIDGFKQSPGKGFEGVIFFIVGLLEIVSTLARILSLCLRLFGNIFAGEILLIVALSSVGLVLPALVLLFGLVVGVIQALVFSALTAANLTEASTAHH